MDVGRLFIAFQIIAILVAPVAGADPPNPRFDIDPVAASLNQNYDQPFRPQFHFTALQGHIGDATGLIYYEGEYHLFCMFDKWERQRNRHKCWGHAVSHDGIHWEELPPILDPLIDHKPGSGSGIVDWNDSSGLRRGAEKTLIVFYTDYQTGSCIAYSNDRGRTWVRHPKNPILPGTDNIRDPLVIWYPPSAEWRMVRFERKAEEKKGDAASLKLAASPFPSNPSGDGFCIYASKNLIDWKYLSRVEGYYECPDFFELPVEGTRERKWVLMGANCDYQTGTFDGTTFTPDGPKQRCEFGGQFYAPQTWKKTPDGQDSIIQMGFLNYPLTPALTWHNQMAFPVRMTLKKLADGVRLCREPIEEVATLRASQQVWRDLVVKPGENPLSQINGDAFEIRVDLDVARAASVALTLRGLEVRYAVGDGVLSVGKAKAPLKLSDGKLRLHLLLDRSSVEVFADQGEISLSRVFFPDVHDKNLALTAEGGDLPIRSLEVCRLEPIWHRGPHP